MKTVINFDANASHSLLPEVYQAVTSWGADPRNPSSIHSFGQRAKGLIEDARAEISALLALEASERVIFTSGATEANNLALALLHHPDQGPVGMVTSLIEHPSVLRPARELALRGVDVRLVSPAAGGELGPEQFLSQCDGATRLLSVMLANNETGQILPVGRIAAQVKHAFPHVRLHCDAVQALGKMEFSFADLGVDLLSISGHKLGALSGVGALVAKEDMNVEPLLIGGGQEGGLRAGTENVLGIYSLGIAARVVRGELRARIRRMQQYGDHVWQALRQSVEGVCLSWDGEPRLPNTLSILVPGVRADDLVVAADLEGVAISAGPACAAGKPEPSPVLLAMGLSAEQVQQTFRLSLESYYAPGILEKAVGRLVECIERLRQLSA